MSQNIASLDQLREVIRRNQQQGNALPSNRQSQVFADPQGNIKMGSQVDPAERRQVSQIHQGTFAWFGRRSRDEETALLKLPANTRPMQVGDVEGYLYSFQNAFGHSYTMFAYYAGGGEYAVLVVFPAVEQRYRDVHNTHLYPDATICFGDPMRSLEQAYGKSVLWANGFSCYQHTGRFQFSPPG